MKKLKVKNMSNFQLSSHIDANKVFLYKRSELEGRWDPLFYSSNYRFIIQNTKFELSKLGNVILYSKSGFGAGKNDQADSLKNGVIHIRPTNLNKDGLLTVEKSIYVPERKNETTLSIGDVLFNNTNSQELVGKTGLYSSEQKSFLEKKLGVDELEKLYFSNHITCIRVDNAKITPEYLWLILNLYQSKNIFYSLCTNWNNQSGIGLDLLRSLKIPIPGLEQQKSLTNLLLNAQAYRQQKEQEAQNLLDSIDDYLMKELGIELPEVDNSLESRVFKTNFSKCQGKRLDSYYHQTKFDLYFKAFKKSVYPVQKLQNITRKITSGITPTSGGEDYVCQTDGIPFIRSGDIEINGDIDLSNLLYISKSIHNTEMKSSQLKENDILIAIVGATIGQVGIYKYQYEANINQAIALVRLKDGYNPNYIKEILKSFVGQINLEHLKRPVARANINLQEISQIQLIIPSSLEKQNQIVAHIQSIREQAKQLQNDAQQQFEEAKKEIEQMILGER